MINSLWTIDSVRAELPDVPVQVSKTTVVMARVSGRKDTYATVRPYAATVLSYEFSWAAITHALNNGQALHV